VRGDRDLWWSTVLVGLAILGVMLILIGWL
jgi:hypothetical protein